MNSGSTKNKGDFGEKMAVDFLEQKGFSIIEKQYRYGKGEIDLIAWHGNTLVFIEVKTRLNLFFGLPEEGITKGKILQIRKTAEAYLHEKKIIGTECRFDVVGILKTAEDEYKITHLENAFE